MCFGECRNNVIELCAPMARQKKDDLIELPSPNNTRPRLQVKIFFSSFSNSCRMMSACVPEFLFFSLFLFLSMELEEEEEARSQDLPTTTQWSINAIDNSSSFAYAGMWRPVMLPRPHCFRRAIHAENTEPISILLGSWAGLLLLAPTIKSIDTESIWPFC